MRDSGKGILGALVVSVTLWVLALIGAWWVVYETVRILMPVMIWLDK